MMKNLLKLSWSDKKLYACIFLLTGYYRRRILKTSFSDIAVNMGSLNQVNDSEANQNQIEVIMKYKIAIERVSRHTIWESKCLVKALVLQKLMTKHQINHTIYFGLAKNDQNEMIAHAWVKCGDVVVIGGQNSKSYSTIATFGSKVFESL